jgi:DNA-binding Lrp family transcriptional regulator
MECHIRCFDIQTAVGVSPSTVYRGLEKLEKYGFLTRRKFRDGAYQCLEIKLKPTCLKLWKYSEVQRVASSFDHSSGGAVTTSSLPRLDRQKEDYLSEAAKELLSLTEEDFEARFPRLVESHFGPQNLMQIVHELSSEGKPLELIMDSLEYANFDIEMGQFVDGKGKEVGSKSGYLYIALRNSYQYPRPSNYISKEELAAQEAEKRLEEVRSAIKRKEDAMYNIWLEGLSKEDKVQVESTLLSLPGPKHRRYRPYWEEHVKGKEDQVRTSCLEASACSGEDSQVDQRQKPDKEHGEAPLASKTYPQQE